MTDFEQVMAFFEWCREQGAVHIKGPGGFEAMWLPPEPKVSEEVVPDTQYEEVNMSQWAKMRPPGLR